MGGTVLGGCVGRSLAAAAAAALAGCAGLGTHRLSVDRADYAQGLRESEKAQLLSNIVAMRYGDAPMFLSVASVISQYSLEATVGTDAAVVLRETPTATYTPMSGERFARSLLSPIPPESLLAMMESGWDADVLFRVAVRTINGVGNVSRAPLFDQDADPGFGQATAALRRLQRSGAISVRLQEHDEAYSATGRLSAELNDAQRADVALLRRLLGLAFDGRDVRIVFADQPGSPAEVAIATRSMFEILQEMSQGVDVSGEGVPAGGLVRIHSGEHAPPHAHVAVTYNGRRFWISGDDAQSKQLFLVAQVIMSLSDTGDAARSPLVTIPSR